MSSPPLSLLLVQILLLLVLHLINVSSQTPLAFQLLQLKNARPFLELMNAALRRAWEDNHPSRASFFQSIFELVDHVFPYEGFERNWHLLMETWKRDHGELLFNVCTYVPDIRTLSDHPETVFTLSDIYPAGFGLVDIDSQRSCFCNGKEVLFGLSDGERALAP